MNTEGSLRRFLALLVAVSALGCGGDSTTSLANEPVSGTYTLRTVNRLPLPYVIADQDSIKVELLSDSFTLTDDKKWSKFGTRRVSFSGQVVIDTIADAGTYVLNAPTITLISTNGSIDGSVAGGKLTLTNDAVVAVYQK